MSQNKTVIQGLEPADSPNQSGGAGQSFYSRGGGQTSRGTVVPGMSGNFAGGNEQRVKQPVQQPQQKASVSGKPVVGFLYSVSRTAAGEFWPLHIGQNTIGQNPSCDIPLAEGTVSSEHAVLVVRKMKNPEKVIASISDARSTNGTMINGESLGFSAVEIITSCISFWSMHPRWVSRYQRTSSPWRQRSSTMMTSRGRTAVILVLVMVSNPMVVPRLLPLASILAER